MKNIRGFGTAVLVSLVTLGLVFTLSGCAPLASSNSNAAGGSSSADPEASAEATAAREAFVNESKLTRYFSTIVDDPTSLVAFTNQMPKGADVRLVPSQINNPSQLGGLPIAESEYREIVTKAVIEHIGYLEIVANVAPGYLEQLDAIAQDVTQKYTDEGDAFEVKINFLAAVSGDLTGEDFEREFKAAVALDRASDRVVGVVILAATTPGGHAAFADQMKVIDTLYTDEQAANSAAEAEAVAASESDEAASAETSDDAASAETSDEAATVEIKEFPRITVSITAAAEASVSYEAMTDRVKTAIDLGHVARIDFAETIIYEANAYSLLKDIVGTGISVAIIPSVSLAVSAQEATDKSTYRFFSSTGAKTVLVSRNALNEQLDLTASYVQAAYAHGLTYTELKKLAYNAIDASFLSPDEQAAQRTKLEADFLEFEKNMSATLDELSLPK